MIQDILFTSIDVPDVRGFFCIPVTKNRIANSEIRSQKRFEAQPSTYVGYRREALNNSLFICNVLNGAFRLHTGNQIR